MHFQNNVFLGNGHWIPFYMFDFCMSLLYLIYQHSISPSSLIFMLTLLPCDWSITKTNAGNALSLHLLKIKSNNLLQSLEFVFYPTLHPLQHLLMNFSYTCFLIFCCIEMGFSMYGFFIPI